MHSFHCKKLKQITANIFMKNIKDIYCLIIYFHLFSLALHPKTLNLKHFNRAMLDRHITVHLDDLFLIHLAPALAQLNIFYVWSERDREDAVYEQCSAVQTLYIFYYYIVVYIYCMHLSGQKSTCFMVFCCWLWKLQKRALLIIIQDLDILFFLGKLENHTRKKKCPIRLFKL